MEKRSYPLNRFGYITKWLVSGPLETPIDPATRTIVDQGRYEGYLKKKVHAENVTSVPENITLGAPGLNGMPWRYYQEGENYFVDMSRFYFTIHKCEFWGATVLLSPSAQTVAADIWSYTAVDVWLNGEHVFAEPICAYSPMRRDRIWLRLREGENLLFMQTQNSCTRDTRNIAAISLPGNPDVRVTYPGEHSDLLYRIDDAAQWLASVRYDGTSLTAKHAPRETAFFSEHNLRETPWVEGDRYTLPAGQRNASLAIEIEGTRLTRKLEMTDRILPPPAAKGQSLDEVRRAYLERIADYRVPEKIGGNSNLYYTVYARLALGRPFGEEEERVVLAACKDALDHCDCSDFRLCYLLKSLWQKLPLSESAAEAIRQASMVYSFWMDEPAIGAMCYGSENHALLFHTSQLVAGMLWPDAVFARSGRTGREQEAIARRRIDDWMKRIERNGFSEFLSGGYTPITAAALLVVYDCAGGEMTVRAGKLLDKIFYDLALNSFDGTVIAPQGRIYRSVLTPWVNGTQAMLYYATGEGAPAYTEWMTPIALSEYKIPADVAAYAKRPGMTSYLTAGTKIQTYKSEGFMMTSLPVPMVGEGAPGPFRPGEKGYQQHLFYASLGGACTIFAHHPGGSHDGTQIRPGYWYGNGYFPHVEQKDNVIASIFRIDGNHPIPFAHMFFPLACFDEVEQADGWMFGRRGDSFVAVWCSRELTLHDEDIVQGADFRAEGGSSAWLFVCGDKTVAPDFASFKGYARAKAPTFDEASLTMTYDGHSMKY